MANDKNFKIKNNVEVKNNNNSTAPSFTFTGYTDTGIGRQDDNSADRLNLITDGTTRAYANVSGFFSQGNLYSANAGDFRNFGGEWHGTTGVSGNGFRFTNTADGVDALVLSAAGNAVFAGEVEGASLDINGNADISGNLVLGGNLTVNGSTTTLNTSTLTVDDLNITVADGAANAAAADGAGITVAGSLANMVYQYSNDRWTFNKEVFAQAGFMIGTTATDVGLIKNSSGVFDFQAQSGREISFSNVTNGEHVRIDASGNVGIGTNDPDVTLHLEDSSRVDIKFEKTGSETHYIRKDGNFLRFRGHDDSTVLFELKNNTDGSNAASFPNGNLGIGTTSPNCALHVNGQQLRIANGNPILTLQDTTDDDDHTIRFQDNGGTTQFSITSLLDTFNFVTNGSRDISFQPNNSEVMRIKSSGNVGIGTNNPSTPLHVIGDITSTGTIKTTNGFFQADEDSQKFRQYHIDALSGGASFLLGKIENSGSTDGGVEGVVRFAYDFGSTTNNCAIHFNFAQRSGTARGTWWYEHDDQDGSADRVHVRLIDDGAGNMYVWVTCADYAETFIEANWRHGASIADSGTLSSGTVTTGTTLFDTANAPTSEMHIGKLFAHDNVYIPDSKYLLIGDGEDLQLQHNGSHSYIRSNTGDLYIRNNADDKDIVIQTDNGSSGVTDYMRFDGSSTTTKIYKNLVAQDNVQIQLGTGADLRLYHSDGNGFIHNDTGTLYIENDLTDGDIIFRSDNGSGGFANYIQIDGSEERTLFNKHIRVNDNVQVQVGSSADLQILHDASDSFLINNTGDLYIRNNTDDKDIIIQTDNGSGGTTNYMLFDGSNERIVISKNITHSDNVRARFGGNNDLQIYHDGSNSVIADTGTGNLFIRGENNVVIENNSGSNYFEGTSGGASRLYFAGNTRLTTSSAGTDFTGNVTVNVDSSSTTFGNHQAALRIDNTNATANNWASLVFDSNNGSSADISAKYTDHTNNYADLYFSNRSSAGYSTKMVILQDGKVGIGTTSPGKKLTVDGDVKILNGDAFMSENVAGSTRSLIALGTDNILRIKGNDSEGSSNVISMIAGGHVGIATTSPGDARLKIIKPTATWTGSQYTIDANGYSNFGGLRINGADNARDIHKESDASFGIGSNYNRDIFFYQSSSLKRLTIKAGGNVGIGTENPDTKLHVDGVVKIGDTLTLKEDGTNDEIKSTGNVLYVKAPEISIQNNSGNERFHITSAGAVQFNNAYTFPTSDGSANQVLQTDGSGNLSFADAGGGTITSASNMSDNRVLTASGSTTINGESNLTFDGSLLRVTNNGGHTSGNISISQSSLDIYNPLEADTNEKGSILTFSDNYYDGSYNRTIRAAIKGGTDTTGNTADGFLAFYTDSSTANSATERMRITKDGRLGIGTTSPFASLHVNGGIIAVGDGTNTTYYEEDKIHSYATSGFTIDGREGITLETSSADKDIVLRADDGSGGLTSYITVDGSTTTTVFGRNTNHPDTIYASFGTGNDLQITHNNTDSFIHNYTGDLKLIQYANDKDISFQSDDGSGGNVEYMRLDGSITKTVFNKDSKHNDGIKAHFGTNDDLRIQHTGSTGYVANYTGTLSIQNNTDDGDVVIQSDNGSGSIATYFMADGSSGSANLYHYGSLKLNTSSSGITVTGGATISGNCSFNGSSNQMGGTMDFGNDVLFEGNNTGGIFFDISDDAFEFSDNARAKFGNGSDLAIYHDGSNSYITEGGTGDLLIQSNNSIRLRATSGENMIQGIADGAVTLYYDNSAKLATTSTGVTVTGLLSATTKSFDIPHPSKEDWRLRYGSLEGPENGVYVRGKSKEKVISLPDYWVDLVHEDSITVQLTAIGGGQNLYVEDIKDNKVYVNGENYFYYIQAERKDVEKLEVEYEG